MLIRVSSDASAAVERTGVTTAAQPELTVAANASISAPGVTLDSSYGTSLDPAATIKATALALNSGQITIALTNPGTALQTLGLVLSGNALATLQSGLQSLSLLSYTSIDIYGACQIGALASNGQPSLQSLSLSAGEIRGFNNGGGQVTFAAQSVTLDNNPGGSGPGPVSGDVPEGTVAFVAGTIQLGANQLEVDQYANVLLNASASVLGEGSGAFEGQQNLSVTTPLITAAGVANQNIAAGGAFTINAPSGADPAAGEAGGLGAALTLVGGSLTENSTILLPSGNVTLHATTGDLSIGGRLDAGGQARAFFDLMEYTNGGQVSLMADDGNVHLDAGSVVTVAAQAAAMPGLSRSTHLRGPPASWARCLGRAGREEQTAPSHWTWNPFPP